jgi:hypothetical protein
VSTVCSSTLLGGLVDLDVFDDQVAGVKTFGVGVCLGVLQETQEELGGLDGPSSTGDTELLAYPNQLAQSSFLLLLFRVQAHTLGSTSGSSSISSHRNSLLVLLDVLEELHGPLQFPSVDSLCGFPGVLV